MKIQMHKIFVMHNNWDIGWANDFFQTVDSGQMNNKLFIPILANDPQSK